MGDQLTETQQRILAALVRPMREGSPYETPATNREIADEVFLSVDAVKGHLRALYAKFYLADLPQNAKRARLAEIALSGQLDPPEPRPPSRIPVIGRAPSLAGSSLLVVASVLMLVGLGWTAGIGKQDAADRFAAPPPAQDAPGAAPEDRTPTGGDRDRARDRFEFSNGDVIGGFVQETGGAPVVEDLGAVPVSFEQDLPIAGDEPVRGRGRGPAHKVEKQAEEGREARPGGPARPAPSRPGRGPAGQARLHDHPPGHHGPARELPAQGRARPARLIRQAHADPSSRSPYPCAGARGGPLDHPHPKGEAPPSPKGRVPVGVAAEDHPASPRAPCARGEDGPPRPPRARGHTHAPRADRAALRLGRFQTIGRPRRIRLRTSRQVDD